jgi:hypothetical protein
MTTQKHTEAADHVETHPEVAQHTTTPATPATPVKPKKFEAPIGTPTPAADNRTISAAEQAERDWLDEPKDLLAERAFARAEGKTVAPRFGRKETVSVKNIHTHDISLESGIIQPGQSGAATLAERSNLLGEYVE